MILRLVVCLCIGVFAHRTFAAGIHGGSSEKSEQLFQTQQCIRCHSIHGKGGNTAPDLGRRIGRDQTPEALASILWNHAPAMWSEMGRQGITSPVLSPQDAADLFAFFYSSRFFDKPGDAGR